MPIDDQLPVPTAPSRASSASLPLPQPWTSAVEEVREAVESPPLTAAEIGGHLARNAFVRFQAQNIPEEGLEQLLETWEEALADIPAPYARAGFLHVLRTLRFAPAPADVRDAALKLLAEAQGRLRAEAHREALARASRPPRLLTDDERAGRRAFAEGLSADFPGFPFLRSGS